MAETVRERIEHAGIVPVLRAGSTDEALALAAAMVAGGITVLEVTTTLPDAVAVLRRLRAIYGDGLLLGSGTVTTAQQCDATIAAGAEFVVSPAFVPEVIACARAHGKLMVSGALTPTEILGAWRQGADIIKVFPCSAMGGASYLKAIHAPLPEIPLLPTGGITLSSAEEFLQAGAIALGVGSDLVNTSAIRSGKPETITETARAYCGIVERWRTGVCRA